MRRRLRGRPGSRPLPLSAAPGRLGLETKAGRAPRSTHHLQDRGALMSLRRDEHAQKRSHWQLISVSTGER
jgi:hypothetical protein